MLDFVTIGKLKLENLAMEPESVRVYDELLGAMKVLKVVQVNTGAYIRVALFGGNLLSYTTRDGKERLFISEDVITDGRSTMHGGAPIVFPQFGGNGPLPSHGLARISEWKLIGDVEFTEDGKICLTFGLCDTLGIKEHLGSEFKLEHKICFGAHNLDTKLSVTNLGTKPFEFQFLLHTYYRLASIHDARLSGLQGKTYADKVRDFKEFIEDRKIVDVRNEIDRVYRDVHSVELECGDSIVNLEIEAIGGDGERKPCNLVVWNPWIDQSKAYEDFADEDYKTMICLEPGVVDRHETCRENETWSVAQRINF